MPNRNWIMLFSSQIWSVKVKVRIRRSRLKTLKGFFCSYSNLKFLFWEYNRYKDHMHRISDSFTKKSCNRRECFHPQMPLTVKQILLKNVFFISCPIFYLWRHLGMLLCQISQILQLYCLLTNFTWFLWKSYSDWSLKNCFRIISRFWRMTSFIAVIIPYFTYFSLLSTLKWFLQNVYYED